MSHVDDVMGRVNYDLLRRQRLALLLRDEEWADGLMNFIDALVDAAIDDGIPAATEALLTVGD